MSVDLSEFEALAGPRKRAICPLGVALETLDKTESDQLRAAIACENAAIGSGAIAKWCQRRDLAVRTNQVTAHRHGKCSCHE